MKFVLSILSALALVVLASAAEIAIGDSREEVLKRLPKPNSAAKRGDREIFLYPNGGRIEFEAGKVVNVQGSLPLTEPAPAAPLAGAVESSPAAATPPPEPKSARGAAAPAAEPAAADDQHAALVKAGVKVQTGPATVALGKVAELKIPARHHFIGPDSLDRFYELTHNIRNGSEVGVLIGPDDWMLFFDYNDVGYVKDEEKDKLDADKLMKSMTAGEDETNEERQRRGWDAMKVKGWASAPHYDTRTNQLKWAINLSSGRDGFKEVWINESIRLLGRRGMMNVTLVTDPQQFAAAEAAVDRLLAENFAYVAGEKYSEFKAGDKIAEFGLTALVVGGAGAMAAKAGLFAKLGTLFAKMGKAIVAVFIAIAAIGVKLYNKITGARPQDSSQ